MRWSLIISFFAAFLGIFTLSAYGLAIPSDLDDGLVSRGRSRGKATVHKKTVRHRPKNPLNQGSAKDRKASAHHGHKYDIQQNKAGMRKWHADHIFEKQMVHGHLKESGLTLGKAPQKTQDRVKAIINGPGNLAPIPGSINASKGATVRNAMKGNNIKQRGDRNRYMKQAYPQAKKVADELDKAYKAGGVNLRESPQKFLDRIWSNAGIHK